MPRPRRETAAKASRNGGKDANANNSAKDDANDEDGPKLPGAANPYIYVRVPFGFPPWYLDNRAESSAELWAKLADRHRSMSARASNMSLAVQSMRAMKRPVRRGEMEDRSLLGRKIADAADTLKAFSDIRKGSPVTVTERPLQLLNYAEDCLWMALICLCRILEARLPRDIDGPDWEWEERLKKLVQSVAV